MKTLLILLTALALAGCAARNAHKQADASDFRLGSHHLKVATASKEAQRAFDRGLTWMYSFGYHAAEQEFRRATELDPKCAMAWWGIAMVSGPHINFPMVPPDRAKTAWEAMEKAREHAAGAGELEQQLIAAAAKRYAMPQPEDRSGLDRAYADAMREVWQKNQTDDDVATLFAEAMMDLRPWDLWRADGKPQPGTPEIVEALERVLWLNPKHPGANHYYIHVTEASPQAEKALSSARRLKSAVPGSGHMVHMPSHIYARVGDWKLAAESNVAAMRADTLYRAVYPRPGFYALYMAHNGHFLAWTAMMEGRSAFALEHARGMVKAVPEEFIRDMGPVVDGFLAFVPEVLMRFGKWEEILNEPRPPGNLPYSTAMWHYARAAALAALDRVKEARAEQNVFEEAAKKVPDDAAFGNNSCTNLLTIARRTLAGEIAAREGKHDEAIANLREGARIEDGLRYDEPPDWIQPVRHTLGAVLLKAGKPAEAEAVYREDLQRHPHNAWSLYGLADALRAQNKIQDANVTRARFQKAWSRADTKIGASCLCIK